MRGDRQILSCSDHLDQSEVLGVMDLRRGAPDLGGDQWLLAHADTIYSSANRDETTVHKVEAWG